VGGSMAIGNFTTATDAAALGDTRGGCRSATGEAGVVLSSAGLVLKLLVSSNGLSSFSFSKAAISL
jgi:hypothetical protein